MVLGRYLSNRIIANDAKDKQWLTLLNQYMGQYQIFWVDSPDLAVPVFPVTLLSQAKGLEADDYSKNLGSSEEKSNLPGTDWVVKGEALSRLKAELRKAYGSRAPESIKFAGKLTVCDWKRACWYLSQGNSEASSAFTGMTATLWQDTVQKEAEVIETPVSTEAFVYTEGYTTQTRAIECYEEALLQRELLELAAYAQEGFDGCELPVKDYYRPGNTYRRYDLWRRVGNRTVQIVELKATAITRDIINHHIQGYQAFESGKTVDYRGYLRLAGAAFPGKRIDLVFCSNKGLSPCGQEALILLGAEEKYRTFEFEPSIRARVRYLAIEELGMELFEKAQAHYKHFKGRGMHEVVGRFPHILPAAMLPPGLGLIEQGAQI